MPTINWEVFTDRGNLAGTMLDSLANDTLSAVSTELENQTNKDTHAMFAVSLGSLNPVTPPALQLYMIKNPGASDGYEEAPVIDGLDRNTLIATIPVPAGSATKRVMTGLILIPPCPLKFYIGNKLNVTTAASGNTLDVYTANLASA